MRNIRNNLTKVAVVLLLVAGLLAGSLIPASNNFVLDIPVIGQFVRTLYVGFAGVAYAGNITPDYIIDGTDDQVQINQAVADLADIGGKVQLMQCDDVHPSINITAAIVLNDNIWLAGSGKGNTIIKTTTPGISMISATGNSSNQVFDCKISDMTIDGEATSVYGINWTYVVWGSEINNVRIQDCYRNGLLLTNCWDDNYYNLEIFNCGALSSYPNLYITGSGGEYSNWQKFYGLHIEDFNYRGVELSSTVIHCQFFGTKIHGDYIGTKNTNAIYVAGDYNQFSGTTAGELSNSYAHDAIVVTNGAIGNTFTDTTIWNKTRYGINSDGSQTSINGLVCLDSSVQSAVLLTSNADFSTIRGANAQNCSSTVIEVDADSVEITACEFGVNVTAIQIDGNYCGITGNNIWYAGSASLYAIHITGDYNRIVSNYIAGGTAAKATVNFPSGADENIVMANQMDNATVDAGAGNIIEHNNVY